MKTILTQKGIFTLNLASVYQDPITLSEKWISEKDLGISGNIESEWDQYCINLNEAGVSLSEKEDTLIWTGGDSSGRMTVKIFMQRLFLPLSGHR
jgi:hypothetical protein